MRGTILGVYDGRGVVLSGDDRRLEFPLSEWRSAGAPAVGQVVDFVETEGAASAVFATPGPAPIAAAQSGSFVLACVAVGCLVLGLIIPLLPTLAAFVLGVVAAAQARTENDANALVLARIAWIGALVMLALGILAMLAVFMFVGTLGMAALWSGG